MPHEWNEPHIIRLVGRLAQELGIRALFHDTHYRVVLDDAYRRGLELVRGEFEERTWQMFWLVVVEDRLPADVAAQLGVSPAAVRKAKSRVLHRLKEEVGDLIFASVALARQLGVDPETALRRTARKFRDRLARMEATARERGTTLKDLPPGELDRLWAQAKGR